MTLVKLDSGDYINAEAVEVIKGGDNPYIGLRSNNSYDITPADRDRIVEAMRGSEQMSAKELVQAIFRGMQHELNAQRRRGNIL
ncbi:hypothetical protein [Lacticaseibacillus absianus]|uniref:hypothetical protein n=1 Tax=Lacticaseibacillus absianus TaxID=2729623 RepID=UPI0015CE56FA|nr:hypothetical protein [Lacticaseibacillus absianus]